MIRVINKVLVAAFNGQCIDHYQEYLDDRYLFRVREIEIVVGLGALDPEPQTTFLDFMLPGEAEVTSILVQGHPLEIIDQIHNGAPIGKRGSE